MLECTELALSGERFQRCALPDTAVAVDVIHHRGREHKKAAIDQSAIAPGLFLKAFYFFSLQLQHAKASGGQGRSERGFDLLGLVKGNQRGDVDVADAVAIGKAKRIFTLQIGRYALEPSAGHGGFTRIHQGYPPRLSALLVYFHAVVAHVEGHIRHVQKVVGEVFLDQVALVTAANHEIVDAVVGIDLHDVPQDGLAANFHHRLGFEVGFFGNPGAESTGKNDCFHGMPGEERGWKRVFSTRQ